jgi:hypothetical protein
MGEKYARFYDDRVEMSSQLQIKAQWDKPMEIKLSSIGWELIGEFSRKNREIPILLGESVI